jgi:hypothetical protein
MNRLRELSELLGVNLERVVRDPEPEAGWDYTRGQREPGRDIFGNFARRGWRLRIEGRWQYIPNSDELRRPRQLNPRPPGWAVFQNFRS